MNTNYVKLNLITGDVYTQARCRYMETQAESVCSPGAELVGSEFQGYHENSAVVAIVANGLTLDMSLTNNFDVNLNANIDVFAITNVPPLPKVATVTIRFTADGTLRTITWPITTKWPSGAAPVMTSTNLKVDIITLMTMKAGAPWYGFVGGQNF